jgi:acetylglutamate kinase
MAVACAGSFGAEKLIFLTDVDGVKDSDGKILETLSSANARQLIADGVATGGMQAKLEAATSALRAGVAEIVIAPGARAGILAEILAGKRVGTRIVHGNS